MATLTTKSVADRNVGWNFAVNLVDIIFFTLGLSLVSRETVMPALMSNLTDSNLLIGLAAALYNLGYYLPQLLTANFTERLRYKKPFVLLLGGVGERGSFLVISLVIWLFAAQSPGLALALFLFFLTLGSTCSGTATPAWYDIIAKVIPVNRRGIFSGMGHSIGAFIGILGAIMVGQILTQVAYPTNFALCFLLAFASFVISFLGLALTREPPSETVKEHVPLAHYMRQLPAILRKNGNYARFLLFRTIILLGGMATGFFIVYGIECFQVDGAGIGRLTAVLVGSSAVMNLVWGAIGDRYGYKLILVSAALCMAMAALNAWLAPSQAWLALTFVLVGIAQAGDSVSSFNIILEFCSPEDRPTYIGLTNTLLAPTIALAPLIGGWLANMIGFQSMFLVALCCAVSGGVGMFFWVQEPRK